MSEHRRKRDFIPKKEVQQQLDDLRTQGLALHYERDFPVTAQDITKIKRSFFKAALPFIIRVVPFVGAIYFFQEVEIVVWVSGAILLFLIGSIIKEAIQLVLNLRAGTKTLVRGVITDRYTRIEFGEQDEDGKRSETVVNYLQIGTREVMVDSQIYDTYRIADAIELCFIVSKGSKPYYFYHSKLKDASLPPGI